MAFVGGFYKLLDKNFNADDFTYNTPFDRKVMRKQTRQIEIMDQDGIPMIVDEEYQIEEYEQDINTPFTYTYISSSDINDDQSHGFVVYRQPVKCLPILHKYSRIAEVGLKNFAEINDHVLAKELQIIKEISMQEFINMCDGELIDDHGNHKWYLHGKIHRDDGPAIIDIQGNQSWYSNGIPHRIDGPAIIDARGNEIWYLNGVLHRIDGPAITRGTYKSWYENGKRINRRF